MNVFFLDGFDASSIPIRKTEGASMTVEVAYARPEWPGPKRQG